jgi:uncharacterized membrane protein
MLTELMLAAMESSEYRTMQYPDDKGGDGWGIIVLIVVLVLVLLWFILAYFLWGRQKR